MSDTIRVRILFADQGSFHSEDLELHASAFEGYDRLIDGLQEDENLLKRLHLDMGRVAGAWILGEDED